MNAAALRNRSPASQGREGEFFVLIYFNISEMFFMAGVQNAGLHRLCIRGWKGE